MCQNCLRTLVNENLTNDISSDYNLDNYFDKYNKLYFDNKLVKDFPLAWNKSTRQLGYVKIVYKQNMYKQIIDPKILKFTIAKNYQLSEEQFTNVMLHEMIHVWQVQNNLLNKKSDYHGKMFQDKATEINNYGHNITIDEPEPPKLVNQKLKEPIILLKFSYSGKNNYILFNYKLYTMENIKGITNYAIRMADMYNKVIISFYEIYDPNIKTLGRVSRKFKTINNGKLITFEGMYRLSDKSQNIIDNSKHLNTISLNKGDQEV